jgi:hypothetical protein
MLAVQVFFTAWERMMINIVHLAFFELVAALVHVRYSTVTQSSLGLAAVCSSYICILFKS